MGEDVELTKKKFSPTVIIVVLAIIVAVAILVYVGWRQTLPVEEVVNEYAISEAERQALLETLRRPAEVPPLSEADRASLEASLEQSSDLPPLTEAERDQLLRALQTN